MNDPRTTPPTTSKNPEGPNGLPERVLLFMLGNRRYGLDAERIVGLAEWGVVFPVPGSHRSVIGLTEWRGEILTVLDLAPLLGIEATDEPRQLAPIGDGFDLILEVEVQGARQLYERHASAVFVFLIPPSMDELERRLRERGSDDEPINRKRLARAHEEIREIHGYQYVVMNEDIEQAVQDLLHIIRACRLERERMLKLYGDRFDFD